MGGRQIEGKRKSHRERGTKGGRQIERKRKSEREREGRREGDR